MEFYSNCQRELAQKQIQLRDTLCDKISSENRFSLETLIQYINNDIQDKNAVRNKLIQAYLNKKCSFDDFVNGFKIPSVYYHKLNIYKEKLYQLKNNEELNN